MLDARKAKRKPRSLALPAIHCRRRAKAPQEGWIFNQISGGIDAGCQNPDQRYGTLSVGAESCRGAWSLGGPRSAISGTLAGALTLALCRGRCAMSRAARLKSNRSVSLADSEPPAAGPMPVMAVRSQTSEHVP